MFRFRKILSSFFVGSLFVSSFAYSNVLVRLKPYSTLAKIWLDGDHARELNNYLAVAPELNYRCAQYHVVVTGGDGDQELTCIRYTGEVIKRTKHVDGLRCEEDLENGHTTCQFPEAKVKDLILAGQAAPFGGNSNVLGRTVRNAFISKDHAFELSCKTLIEDRYFDCFIKLTPDAPGVMVIEEY